MASFLCFLTVGEAVEGGLEVPSFLFSGFLADIEASRLRRLAPVRIPENQYITRSEKGQGKSVAKPFIKV